MRKDENQNGSLLLQVTAPELIRRDVESASFAVLDLHGALDWSNHNCRIVAIAYMNLHKSVSNPKVYGIV
jgi:hypothetical protein